MSLPRLLAIALLSSSLIPVSAQAEEDAVRYTVRKGDTLIDLADKFMIRKQHYLIVQRKNRLKDPRQLPVGKVIEIPRNLLKYTPARARLVSVRGAVQQSAGGDFSNATQGQVLGEGNVVNTSAASFATLLLDDGSRISIPSNSSVRISRLRSYTLGGAIDYDFDVVRGGARSKVSPLKSKDDRYRVRSPKAVSAVRGTDFAMRHDADTGRDFAEVDEGALAVGTGGKDIPLPAGNGLAVAASGSVIQETLLPAPELDNPGKLQANDEVRFAVKGNALGGGHRFQIAADAGFIDQVADVQTADGKMSLTTLPNGNYFIRTREIANSGIQGLASTYAFKRRLNGVKASAGQGADGYAFKWFSDGEGVRRYHFQLFRGQTDSTPMVDEAGLDTTSISISDLPPGDYFWRVGAVQYLDGEAVINWADMEKMTISPS